MKIKSNSRTPQQQDSETAEKRTEQQSGTPTAAGVLGIKNVN
jgi:hypothetical protein